MNYDPRYPMPYPSHVQKWAPQGGYPYPMNFVQAPSYDHQVLIKYRDEPHLQGLSTVLGPVMFPLSGLRGFPTRDRIEQPVNPYPFYYY